MTLNRTDQDISNVARLVIIEKEICFLLAFWGRRGGHSTSFSLWWWWCCLYFIAVNPLSFPYRNYILFRLSISWLWKVKKQEILYLKLEFLFLSHICSTETKGVLLHKSEKQFQKNFPFFLFTVGQIKLNLFWLFETLIDSVGWISV